MQNLLAHLTRWFTDPPPPFLVEVSPQGVAYARRDQPEQAAFNALGEEVLSVNPLSDNVKQPESLVATLSGLFPSANHPGKRRPVAVILPDFAARLQILDFDTFPAKTDEQQALVRFRMKKTVPFDVESAAVSFAVQPSDGAKTVVVAALMSLEIIARYEHAFRASGYHPGWITTSGAACLQLVPEQGLSLLVKLAGRTLTLLATDGRCLRLSRCVELESVDEPAVLEILHPTLVLLEEECRRRPDRICLCGFGPSGDALANRWSRDLGSPVELLRSRFGTPGPHNAGLLGLLEEAA
jgi:type IV pilus assembly protein PilM